jgi:hypothetical protein
MQTLILWKSVLMLWFNYNMYPQLYVIMGVLVQVEYKYRVEFKTIS